MGRIIAPITRHAARSLGIAVLFLMAHGAAFAASTIQGTVYDKARNALVDIEVELLDEFYRTWRQGGRTRTDGAGSYSFTGLPDGRYTVRVFAFRYDLEDQEMPVTIETQNIRGGEGTSFVQQDFFLSPKRGGLADAELGVVFAQEIPAEAKRLYEKALTDLSAGRRNDGIMGLDAAVKAFPTYYLALSRAGRELYIIKQYRDAIPFLIKAAEVNEKSATTFYYLGMSLHEMGKDYAKAARTALHQSQIMAPQSQQVALALGKVERTLGNTAAAETELLKAKKLSKVPNPEIHKELAQLYGNDLKKFKEAADELELYLKASTITGEDAKKIKDKIADLRGKAQSAPRS